MTAEADSSGTDSNTRTNRQKQFHVRMPVTIFHRIVTFAQDRGLSINAAVIVLVCEAFDARDADR